MIQQGARPLLGIAEVLLWREFQEALSAFAGFPLILYDGRGGQYAHLDAYSDIHTAMRPVIAPGCTPACVAASKKAVQEAIEKGTLQTTSCHAGRHIFALPVPLDLNGAFVVIGGPVNTPEAFSLPWRGSGRAITDIIQGLSAPFLKSLYAMSLGRTRLPELDIDRKLARGVHTLDQVCRSITPVLDKEELYDAILDRSSELVGAERGSLMLVDRKRNVLSVKTARGASSGFVRNVIVPLGDGIAGATAVTGVPIIVRDIERESPKRANRTWYRTKSFLSVPLRLDNRVLGVINMADKREADVFTDSDMQILNTFANYASIALERGTYHAMSEEFKALSMADPLTGMFNRRFFTERLYEELERVKRHKEFFTVFFIDIDDFKFFNDTYGHRTGDEILKAVANVIKEAVRTMDVVARYGGEEFAVMLPHTVKKDAFVIAERVRKGVEELNKNLETVHETVTCCVGVSELPGDADTIENVIHKADTAMYLAKKTGKNKVVVYE
ncbi:MAG: sensor domain-containing diguanylate cyclase [Deltaproteobacteria bacterium]|nr:sensor domain-containing diguanylate cyclase [Deltaproteobacteria bacterium]